MDAPTTLGKAVLVDFAVDALTAHAEAHSMVLEVEAFLTRARTDSMLWNEIL